MRKSSLFQYMVFKFNFMYQINFALCLCYNPHHHHHHLHQYYHCAVIIIIVFFLSYFSPSVCPPVRMFVSSCVSIGWFVCVPPYTKLVQKNKKKGKVTILYIIFPQGNQWASPSEEESIMDMQLPLSSSTATPNNQSSEDDHKAPKLYFDVDEAKEKKYATYEDLRKKHRERWNPPSLSSSSQTRKEQVGKVDSLLKRFS